MTDRFGMPSTTWWELILTFKYTSFKWLMAVALIRYWLHKKIQRCSIGIYLQTQLSSPDILMLTSHYHTWLCHTAIYCECSTFIITDYNKKNMSSWKGRNQIFQMWCIQSMLLKTERGRLLVDMDLSVRAEGCDALQKLRRLAGSRAILHLRFRT